MHDGGDPVRIGHSTALVFKVESGEDIAWEHGLMEEDFPPKGGLVVADPRAKRFDIFELSQVSRGDVLALGLGADSVPSSAILEMVGRLIGNVHGQV